MRTVLFVCVENSFRSVVAEAYFNRYAAGGWRAVSAGLLKLVPRAGREGCG